MDEDQTTFGVQTRARAAASSHLREVPPTNPAHESGIPSYSSQWDATNIEFHCIINLLTQLVASQAEHGATATAPSETMRIGQFIRLIPHMFSDMKVEKDPQGFIDEMENIFRTMHASKIKAVEFVFY